jgi:hypothetical protein
MPLAPFFHQDRRNRWQRGQPRRPSEAAHFTEIRPASLASGGIIPYLAVRDFAARLSKTARLFFTAKHFLREPVLRILFYGQNRQE